MSLAYTNAPSETAPMGWLRRTEAWLDSKGRKAWIAAMVLGFVFFWPVGLALVAYITMTNRWSHSMFPACRSHSRHHSMRRHAWEATRPSGNTAFDAYKEDTLRRLEDEQRAFESFLDRLRQAKDKAEFDAFMDERAKSADDERRDDA
jgi:hypothetical protein